MALPDKTLCWVEGPPWDRTCTPADDALELIRDLADEPFLANPEISERARKIIEDEEAA